MKKKLLIVLVLLLISAAAVRVVMRRTGAGDEVVKVSGIVETTAVAVSFKVPGRLKDRLVDEGGQVQTGQVVARLEDDELRDEVRLRTADEQAAGAALADLKAGSRREEISATAATLDRLKAEAERATQDALRAEQLFKKEVIPRKELDAARAARDSAAAAVREGEERLQLTRIGPRPDAVRQAQARLEAAGAARSLVATRLSQAVLTAPLSGFVLAKHAEPGELLAAGSPVITVGRLDEVWVRAYIPETQLGRIKLGQQAVVTSDTWKGRTYRGVVSFIASEAEFTPRNVQTEAERVKLVYRIKITIANPKQELKPGMPVDLVLEAGEKAQGAR